MAETGAQTPRERYRAQVRTEIKDHAWRQIAAAGAPALSLNAIAKQLGMSGPALYRYFDSRDELITALIRDAYRSLADTFRATARSGADPVALAHALRRWALEDPQRYLLVYGTPVPGYHAPEDVTAIAAEIMATLLDACATLPANPADAVRPPPRRPPHLGRRPPRAARGAPPGPDVLDQAARRPVPGTRRPLHRDGVRPGPAVHRRTGRPAGTLTTPQPITARRKPSPRGLRSIPGTAGPGRCGPWPGRRLSRPRSSRLR